MRLFKRKKDKPKKTDFSKYNIKLNLRAMCLFEHLTGKSFYKYTDEDTLLIMYCCFVSSNNTPMTYKAFEYFIDDTEVQKWITKEYMREIKYMEQSLIPKSINSDTEEKEEAHSQEISATDIASVLIVQAKINPYYVYDDMNLWEVNSYFQVLENMKKEEYSKDRLFTYLTVMPQIDTKKCKSPEALIKFPWEKGSKQAAEEDLVSKKDMILATLAKMNKKEETEEENG